MAKTAAKSTARQSPRNGDGRREVRPRSRREWRAWLQKHHASVTGVWLFFAKKHTGLHCPSYNDAVEEALCFGWIDGLVNPVDDAYYKQLFTPRKPKSAWAQSNKARVEKLIAEGLMAAAGLAAIAVARDNGSWGALDHVESLTIPPELQKALDARPAARRGWTRFTDSQRKQFLYRLAGARRDETRAKRIGEIVEWAARGITPAQAYEARRRKA